MQDQQSMNVAIEATTTEPRKVWHAPQLRSSAVSRETQNGLATGSDAGSSAATLGS